MHPFKFFKIHDLTFLHDNRCTASISKMHNTQTHSSKVVVQTNFPNQGMTYLYFLKPKELYFYVGYAI